MYKIYKKKPSALITNHDFIKLSNQKSQIMSVKKRFIKSRKKYNVTFQLPHKTVNSGTAVKVLGDFKGWSWENGISLMYNQKIGLSTFLLFAFVLTGLYAQETIPAAGGVASSSEGTVSYSIGQVV